FLLERVVMTKFKDNIKLVRKQMNMTQKQFASLFGISERAYQYYEAGSREPNLETLILISNKLNVSTDFLLGLSPNQNRN
ncbi:helix-turn-helix domain-containing protein, partial [Clostridioides difficile]